MKSLRELVTRDIVDPENRKKLYIPYMVTGEYGDKTKRPHWHAILFNYRPKDAKFHYKTDRGDDVFTSETLTKLWKRGNLEFGSVTLDSANYVARYAAKKLAHGLDQAHNYHPIHKTSSRRGIGTSWIEKHYEHTLQNGHITLPDGSPCKIPRFYLDWAKKHQPRLWEYYITTVAPRVQTLATEAARKEEIEDLTNMLNAEALCIPMKRARVKETILQSKFKQLQERLKL
ncbi:replication initiator protein [Apis mellifera associated microvirus 26]|nr:replication initiator protein [Apis mellifera associated microvirus 26]